jgi:hypothetical protein
MQQCLRAILYRDDPARICPKSRFFIVMKKDQITHCRGRRLLVDLEAGILSSYSAHKDSGQFSPSPLMQKLHSNRSALTEGFCLESQPNPNSGIKPFLRWAGSKRRQLSRLVQFWKPSHQRYIEPFAGSACLFFEIGPAQAILGDNNESLIEVYRAVRDLPDRLFDRLCRIKRNAETYYRWRAKASTSLDA